MMGKGFTIQDGCQEMANGKNLIAKILLHYLRNQHKFTQTVIIKTSPSTYHHSHFLAATLDFKTFSRIVQFAMLAALFSAKLLLSVVQASQLLL